MVLVLLWRPQGLYPVSKHDDAMLDRLLSGDRPRSRLLGACCCWRSSLGLALAPFLFPGTRSLNVAAKVCVFILLVASYDLLLGYTGIVSFAHTMFFGIGGYGVAIAHVAHGRELGRASRSAPLAALRSRSCCRSLIGLFSLRVQGDLLRHDHAGGRVVLRDPRLAAVGPHRRRGRHHLPGCPRCCRRATDCSTTPVLGVDVNGRILTYYLVFAGALRCFLLLLRIVNSPFGRVLQAIRENEFRAEAIGYRTVIYRTAANSSARWSPPLAGVLYALWLRYTRPGDDAVVRHHGRHPADGGDRRHGHDVRRGRSARRIFVLAQNYLQDLMRRRARGDCRACRCCRCCSIRTAGCCGWACCSCSSSTTSRTASSASCACGAVPEPQAGQRPYCAVHPPSIE